MRLAATAHTSLPWRIHELTRGWHVEDVWALPTPGGPDDFLRLVRLIASLDASDLTSGAVRSLFAVRLVLGALLRWDSPDAGLGSRVPSLRDRLPDDLHDAALGPALPPASFSPLYLLADEWAVESANRTVHAVVHFGWVSDHTGGHRGQLAVLVKPNGLLGSAYMAAIRPFRRLLVYPALLREIDRGWRTQARGPVPRG